MLSGWISPRMWMDVVATRPSRSISLEYSSRRTSDCVSSGSASMSVRTRRRALPGAASWAFARVENVNRIAARIRNEVIGPPSRAPLYPALAGRSQWFDRAATPGSILQSAAQGSREGARLIDPDQMAGVFDHPDLDACDAVAPLAEQRNTEVHEVVITYQDGHGVCPTREVREEVPASRRIGRRDDVADAA